MSNIKEDIKLNIHDYDKEHKETFSDVFNNAIKEGHSKKFQSERMQYKKFDENFIANLESFIPSLDRITRDLKLSIKYESKYVTKEDFKNANSNSIENLMNKDKQINSELEEVEINKYIMNNLTELNYNIYENRFIMTLINRLNDYLSNRYTIIKANMEGFNELKFNLLKEFKINNANVFLNIDLNSLNKLNSNEIDRHNQRVLERVEETYKKVSKMKHSNFMKVMEKFKNVQAPIMQTELLLNNPDFKNAYLLWLYLDRLNSLEYTLETQLVEDDFNRKYKRQINESLLELFKTLFKNTNIGRGELLENSSSYEELLKNGFSKSTENISLDNRSFNIEPQFASDYYYKKIREETKNLSAINEKKTNIKTPLKQILLDQYSIAKQLYSHYFKISQDQDVFKLLIDEKDPTKRYNQAFDKYVITKISREVNEELYLDSLSLENKWATLLVDLHQEALESLMDRGFKETDEQIMYLDKTLERELIRYDIDENVKIRQRMTLRKIRIQKEHAAAEKKYEKQLAKIDNNEKRLLKNAKINLETMRQREVLRIKKEIDDNNYEFDLALRDKKNEKIQLFEKKLEEERIKAKRKKDTIEK